MPSSGGSAAPATSTEAVQELLFEIDRIREAASLNVSRVEGLNASADIGSSAE